MRVDLANPEGRRSYLEALSGATLPLLLAREARLKRELASASAAVHEELGRLASETCPYREGDTFVEFAPADIYHSRIVGVDANRPPHGAGELSSADVVISLCQDDGPCRGETLMLSLATVERFISEGRARIDRKDDHANTTDMAVAP